MFVFVFANLLVDPAVLPGPSARPVRSSTTSSCPGSRGARRSTSVLLIIAIVGTTVAPWQLFFQQSNIIDKRITPRWINYERLDTWIGAVVVVVGAAALMCVSAFAFAAHALLRALHRRRRHRSRAQGGARASGRSVLRARPAERLVDRRGRADALDQLRVRRHLRHQELAAPQLPRRQGLLRDVRRW